MPVLWRYLGGQFLKVFLLTATSLILCLLTLRMEDIAQFISLGSTGPYVLWFVLYQIPYILPIAIPLSCLIASMILMSRLSTHHEISALRALGLSLKAILAPVLLMGAIIALLNFFVTSEVATLTHLKTNLLKLELRTMNPLHLLTNKHLMRVQGFYFDALGPTRSGELASDVVVALPGKEGARMNLFLAKKLASHGDEFGGENLTFITSADEKVLIENIGKTHSDNSDFSHLLQKKVWTLHDDYLGLKSLFLRWDELNETKAQNRLLTELARRFSLGLAPFTFTLMGLAFGLTIGRRESRRPLVAVTGLAALFLATFFFAKGIGHKLIPALLLYGLPHLVIIASSLFYLKKINAGSDT